MGIALALITGVLLGALSQRPIPTPLKDGRNPQELTAKQDTPPTDANQSRQAPPSGPLSKVDPITNGPKPDTAATKHDDQTASPWSVANAGLTLLFNGILAGTTYYLYRIGGTWNIGSIQGPQLRRRAAVLGKGEPVWGAGEIIPASSAGPELKAPIVCELQRDAL
jgi:hypothetical protein